MLEDTESYRKAREPRQRKVNMNHLQQTVSSLNDCLMEADENINGQTIQNEESCVQNLQGPMSSKEVFRSHSNYAGK